MKKKARFYRCRACGLRFPDLAPREGCPSCGGSLELVAERHLREDALGPSRGVVEPPCVAILENIRSAWNVGSMFRTAEAAGFARLYLCGITPAGDHPGVAKTALGAESVVPWTHHPDALAVVKNLKLEGFRVLALETEEAVDWHPELPPPEGPLAVVVGNELTGVDPGVLEACDLTLRLPMRGGKRSLNVAVAFGVVALWLSARRATPR